MRENHIYICLAQRGNDHLSLFTLTNKRNNYSWSQDTAKSLERNEMQTQEFLILVYLWKCHDMWKKCAVHSSLPLGTTKFYFPSTRLRSQLDAEHPRSKEEDNKAFLHEFCRYTSAHALIERLYCGTCSQNLCILRLTGILQFPTPLCCYTKVILRKSRFKLIFF